MKDWHAAQVMPVTGIVTRSGETEDSAAAFSPESSIFNVGVVAILGLLNLRRETNAINGSRYLLRTRLIRIELQLCRSYFDRPEFNSLNSLERCGHPANAGAAVHSFNGQRELILHLFLLL